MSTKVSLPHSRNRGSSNYSNNYHEITQSTNDTTSNNNNTADNNILNTATWRKRGEQVRAALMKQDEANGAQTFILSSSCPIFKYYDVADKVLDQFLHHPIDTGDELLEAYMVGQRLVKFLSIILPTHSEYSTQSDVKSKVARERSLEQLAVVTKYIDQIALLIDKQEHEDYISSVINHHQQEKSVQSPYFDPKQREELYYTDDTDDDGERNSTYLATNNTRGSDTTVRLNNISPGNSGDSSNQQKSNKLAAFTNRDEPRLPLPVPSRRKLNIEHADQSNNLDGSVVSDSVDVLYENSMSRDGLVREDPVSTAYHTILRVVSPYQDVRHTSNAAHKDCLEKSNSFKKADESFGSVNVSRNGLKNQTEMPMVRSHWVAANRSTISNNITPRSADTSFSSVDRSFGSMSRDEAKVTNIVQHSPGGSVRSIIRSWPPKQDPPGDPPGLNSTALKADVPTKGTLLPDVNPPLKIEEEAFETCTSSIRNPPVEAESISLQFTPMSKLQAMAVELEKTSPSRYQASDPKAMSKTTSFLTRRDPSIGRKLARFSSTSYSTSSCERSTADGNDSVASTSCIKARNVVSPLLDDIKTYASTHNLSVDNDSMAHSVRKFGHTHTSSNVDEVDEGNLTDQNVSLDSVGFPKIKSLASSNLIPPEHSLEARIMSIASNTEISQAPQPDKSDLPSNVSHTSNPIDETVSRHAYNPECFDFPVHFGSLEPTKLEVIDPQFKQDIRSTIESFSIVENKPAEKVERDALSQSSVNCNELGSHRVGPVDLDESTSSNDTPLNDRLEEMPVVGRGFATDGLDYVLPLPKGISGVKKFNPVLASYAPSAADWSMEEELDNSNRRFARENSTISIDSTEFSGHPEKIKESTDNSRNIAELQDQSDNHFGPSTDWTPVWSPHDFDSMLSADKSKEKAVDTSNASHSSIGRPDLSYEAWDQVWNNAAKRKNDSHSSDSRKEVIAQRNGKQRGEYCTDRTSSTESSSSTSRSRDVSQDLGSSTRTSTLLDPFSSRTPIEAPFLRDEKESPLMIDSMTEQRLRLPMNSDNNITKRSPNSLNLAPHNVGLYGSLKGFQSLDCILPYDHEDAGQNVASGRGNIMLCRSRAIDATHNRSPNEDDWEESSLLMIESQKSDPKFKSCIRCLLK